MKWLIIFFIAVVVLFGLLAWHTNNSNIEYEKNTWYLNGTIIEKTVHWYGTKVMIIGDDGKRYLDYCRICLIDDYVGLKMQKDYIVRVMKVWEIEK